ncbi:MAG: rod shape-determining protein MreC [Solirubrobacteraceae bacterium]
MYDKTTRRRRAVLGLLVAISLILLTAYFGEPAGGGLHSVQRGFLTVVSPIQDGASRALKPVRDLFGWVGDTLGARGERDRLRKQVRQLEAQSVANVAGARQEAALAALLHLDRTLTLGAYQPVTASVIGQSPNLWYATVAIDRGSADGVHQDDPVLNGDGLVGKVTTVTPHASRVTLITDSTSGVSAKDNTTGAAGILQPAVGNPNELLLQFVAPGDKIAAGDVIVTSGTISSRLDSLFPRDIPIGRVTRVDAGDLFQGVRVSPMVNLRGLDTVQVLTHGSVQVPSSVTPGA